MSAIKTTIYSSLYILSILVVLMATCFSISEKPITIVIASYNNKVWYKKNLLSVFSQNYQNYHVIYIDDCSTDGTYNLVLKYVQHLNQTRRTTLIQNKSRQSALANQYKAIHMAPDDNIIVILDGDDWFSHKNVLSYVNNIYSNNDVWLTYGQCRRYPTGSMERSAAPISKDVIQKKTFREVFPFPFTHLRTFYAWLFKKIRKDDLLDVNDEFFTIAGDVATMMPMVEMSQGHFRFIPDILYIYNVANPINDHKKSRKLQHETSVYIRKYQKRYVPL